MRRLSWLLMFVALFGLIQCGAQSASEATPAQSIAFIRDPDSGSDLWVKDLTTGDEQIIRGAVLGMDWNRNQQKFLVSGIIERIPTLWTTDLAQTEAVTLYSNAESLHLNPRWSPDTTHYTYEEQVLEGDHVEVETHIAKLDQAEPQPLLPSTDASINASWSPDGKWMIAEDAAKGDLVLLQSDGTPVRSLEILGTYSWSPDSKKIVVGTWNPSALATFPQLTIVDITLGTKTVLLEAPQIDHFFPAWSPDGQTIAFIRRPQGIRFGEIWTMNIETGALTQHTNDTNYDNFDLQWSADSSQILLTRIQPEEAIRYSLWLLTVADNSITSISENAWKGRWLNGR